MRQVKASSSAERLSPGLPARLCVVHGRGGPGTRTAGASASAERSVHLWKMVDLAAPRTTAPCVQVVEASRVSSPPYPNRQPMLAHHSTPCADEAVLDLLLCCFDHRARAASVSQMLPAGQHRRTTYRSGPADCIGSANARDPFASCVTAARCAAWSCCCGSLCWLMAVAQPPSSHLYCPARSCESGRRVLGGQEARYVALHSDAENRDTPRHLGLDSVC